MPAKGSKKNGDYWNTNDPDHAPLLQFIHLQSVAGIAPDVEVFLKTPQGKAIEAKRGDKKVKCHFPRVLVRYKDWKRTGGGAGGFLFFLFL